MWTISIAAERLANVASAHPAPAAQTAAFVAALRAGDHAPAGLSLSQLDRLSTLDASAAAMTEAYVLVRPPRIGSTPHAPWACLLVMPNRRKPA
jgi:hypothetical protein